MKKILILTAGFGEGHNAAARGVRDGLSRVARDAAEAEIHDLVAETYPCLFRMMRTTYLGIVNRAPRLWGYFYRWLQQKEDFSRDFHKFRRLRENLDAMIQRFQPDIIVSVFPPYPYIVDEVRTANRHCQSVVVVTDSITINKMWYRSEAEHFLVPNQPSAEILLTGGAPPEKIKAFGFPVSPNFADLPHGRKSPSPETGRRVLYMINAGPGRAPHLVDRLLELDITLTVTVGRDKNLRKAIEQTARGRRLDIVGWTTELPRILGESHILIGKAGGATVQETIAAGCPMIVNHIVSGQEEGNALLIEQTNSGAVALSDDAVISQVQKAFADDAKQWREWSANIAQLSRPRASLDIAEFLMAL